jgi:general secretion pathway protein E
MVNYLSEDAAREFVAFPVRMVDDDLYIAVAEPSEELRAALARASGKPVKLLIAPLSDVRWAIDSNYRALGSVAQLVQVFESVEGSRRRNVDNVEPEIVADDAPVVQVVDRILTQAMRDRASDVHIEPSDDIVRVRFRIDGALKEILQLPAAIGPGLVSRIKIMANMNIVERRRPQDGQLTINIDGKEVDVRVATTATIMGESCVMRLLDKTRSVLRLNDLGMPVDTHEAYSKIVRAPFGMVLCAGPTGSGKTTTLYACINRVNQPNLNILTAEDPVEYEIQGIHQVHVQAKIGLTFASALRAFLRQDPDIVMVGEIRDSETLEIAINASLTGHLVFSTIHTNDAAGAITRTIDMGAEPFLLRSSVIGILAQRLVRVLCKSCKYSYPAEDFELEELGLTPERMRTRAARRNNPVSRYFPREVGEGDLFESFDTTQRPMFYKAKGCSQCTNTGYAGRRGIYELMLVDDAVGPLILKRADAQAIKRAAQDMGMDTLRDDGARKVLAGMTTVEEVLAATQEDVALEASLPPPPPSIGLRAGAE